VRRWTVFNAVGIIGFGVQLAVLAIFLRLGLHYLAAAVLAIESAILHNFLWHERWTWRDRMLPGGGGRGRRLWRFHMLNGFVSLAGNLTVMWALVEGARLPALPANAISVGVCACVNFLASEHLVFQR
jgi:putative flippase GtrA